MSNIQNEITKSQAAKILWNKGNLRWKLHELQKKIYDHFYSTNDEKLTMMIARQSGKSYLMCLFSIEACIRTPGTIVKYVCQTRDMLTNIVIPNVETICADCPEHLKPIWKENKKRYIFPNGSEIQVAGSDGGHYNKIRGGRCHLWIVDEAGFCDDLEDIVYSVLIPTTTTTKGRGILASTPDPQKPDHPFVQHFVKAAQADGNLFKATILDNPMLDEVERNKIIRQYPGGIENVRFQAEYMCIIKRSPESIVVPEFDETIEPDIVTDNYKRPAWFDTYVSMDIGGKDFTVLLLGYYDFLAHKLVIEDEVVLKQKQNSTTIAMEYRRKAQELYGEKPPYMMWSDNNNIILLNDLRDLHGLNFAPTQKDNKEAAINKLRVMISGKQIIIHPRCTTLIQHLRNATWAKSKTSSNYKTFARGSDGSHYDALDALIYLVRNVIYSHNPFPPGYNLPTTENHYMRSEPKPQMKSFLPSFKISKRRINK